MNKFQKAEYIEKNHVGYIEERMSDLDLNQLQYDFMTKALFLSEKKQLKNYQKGISKLIEARKLIIDTMCHSIKSKNIMINSNILEPIHIIKFYLKEMGKPLDSEWNINDLWNIKSEKKIVKYDLLEEEFFGPFIKDTLKKEHQILEIEIEEISVTEPKDE